MGKGKITPQVIDNWISLAAGTVGLVAKLIEWRGGVKLAKELNNVAAKIDAFRTDPVYKEEIDSLSNSSHTW